MRSGGSGRCGNGGEKVGVLRAAPSCEKERKVVGIKRDRKGITLSHAHMIKRIECVVQVTHSLPPIR